MQLQLFTIPVGDSGGSLEAMNRFLRSHKVLEVSERFVEFSAGEACLKNRCGGRIVPLVNVEIME